MKLTKYLIGITVVTLAAAAQAAPLLNEGFDNVAGLGASGWQFQNVSSPGTDWFQGNSGVFASQAGAADSYIASDFLAGPAGGLILNDLITPYFSLESDVVMTFWVRGANDPGFVDTLRVLAQSPLGIESLPGIITATGDWTQYTVNLAGQGAGAVGQFTFEYFGNADTSNYIGIDTVSIASVPEPSPLALMVLGVAGLALVRRRRRAA